MDIGETVSDAAARETLEEVRLNVRVADLVGIYSYPTSPVIVVVYRAEYVSGSVAAGDEALEAAIFPREKIPWDDLAFQSTKDALKDYLNRGVL